MDFGNKDGVEVGNENNMGLIQGVDDKCARLINVFELDQSSLALIALKSNNGLSSLSVLVEEEVASQNWLRVRRKVCLIVIYCLQLFLRGQPCRWKCTMILRYWVLGVHWISTEF